MGHGNFAGELVLQSLQVRINHQLRELGEGDFGHPAELFAGLGGIADEQVHLRRTVVAGVDFDVFLPVKAGVAKGDL